MGKIDGVKEILNTLRIAMSIAFGILVILVGSLVKRFDNGQIDTLYWGGVLFAFAVIGVIVVLILKIAQKTKEIKDL